MKKNLPLLAAALLAALALLLGGTDTSDVNRMIFVTGIGIDMEDDALRCTFYTAVPVGSDKAVGDNNVDYRAATVTAGTLGQAVGLLEQSSDRRVSFEHLNCTALGQSAAGGYLPALLDFLLREPSVRRQCVLLALDTDAESFFGAEYDGSIAARAAALAERQHSPCGGTMTLGRLMSSASDGSGWWMYILDIPSKEEVSGSDISAPGDMSVSGMMLYDRHGATGRLDREQTRLAGLLAPRQRSGIVITVDIGGQPFSYRITHSRCRRKFTPGVPALGSFSLTAECLLTDAHGSLHTPTEEELSRAVHEHLWELLNEGRDIGSAYTLLEKEAMEAHRRWYAENGSRWEHIYSGAVIELDVKCKLEHRCG